MGVKGSRDSLSRVTLTHRKQHVTGMLSQDQREKMAKKDYDQLSVQLLDLIGGPDNIGQVYHCITRLRFSLKDAKKADVEKIAKIPGTSGAQFVGAELQVFIGPDVKRAFDNLQTHNTPSDA